jgi:hypothetical protein
MKLLFGILAVVVACTATASAQTQSVHIRGTIAAYDAGTLTVTLPTGPRKIVLAPNVRVSYVVKSDLSHVVAGGYIGCAATQLPDGTLSAIEITVFPPGVTGNAFSRPYDLGPTSSMTNGSVDTISTAEVNTVGTRSVTIAYPDGKKTIAIPPGTPIVTFIPADTSALTPGAHVNLVAMRADDGSLSAASVQVGKDGLVPPQ